MAGLPFDTPLVALPQCVPGRWTVWAPDDAWCDSQGIAMTDGASWHAYLATDLRTRGTQSIAASRVMGFDCAAVLDLRLTGAAPAGQVATAPWVHAGWQRYRSAQLALLCGVLAGICRRLCEEACAYARTRRSADKPIIQHQAVALRVADIVLQQQALALYLGAAFRPDPPQEEGARDAGPCVAYVSYAAGQIARDAVQVAAAHGYVEGLPFKRLFEQSRALCSVLASYSTPNSLFPEYSA